MQKIYTIVFYTLILFGVQGKAATWERLYSKNSTDCFRHVREVSNGDIIVAGYTANFTSHDTDGIVIRFDDNGDTIWTFTYNGPNNKEDCFYKVAETSDGGFIVCGYSRSFNGSDNAIYLKLNSSGALQWVKNWGGSGIERAQDVVELSNGKFVIVGYTTSSPAHYYDAFILKIDAGGSTVWSKIYGWSNYDDANSLKLLPDGGFIIGGQSNNNLFLIRTDSNGDSLWTKILGTSGTDNIECVNIAQGGDGYILAGHTNGAGNGGDNGYIVRTDSSGNEIWSNTYGGNDNDDFHRVEQTPDGGYFASGTSSSGPWANPNIWILKMDASGTKQWERFYGGDHHDHGYGGQGTSDGGFVVVGHTRSFSNTLYNEDAIIIKTNSSGQVSNQLNYTTVTSLISPVSGGCGSNNVQVQVEITNYGEATVSSIPVTIEITGSITQTLTQTYTSSVARDQSKTMTFNTAINLSAGGTYNFHCFTGNQHDVIPARNYLDETITLTVTSSAPNVTNASHCGPGSVPLSATSNSTVKWYANSSGGTSLASGTTYNTPYINSTTTYYAQAGTTCPSARIPVVATITTGLTSPTASNVSRCGDGVVTLNATSAYTVKWYATATALSSLSSGSSFITPVLNSNSTYYAASENSSCSSPRIPVQAIVNPMPADPVTTDSSRCGNGSVQLSAAGPGIIRWYNVSSGGSILDTGNVYNTPNLSSTSTFYAESYDGTCPSNRVSAVALLISVPANPSVTPAFNCGDTTLVLHINSPNTVEWYSDPLGNNLLATGNSFTTPLLDSSAVYYVRILNANCMSAVVPFPANIYPAISIDLGPDSILSSLPSVDLDPGPGFSSYTWSTSAVSQLLSVNSDGLYCVTVTDANNCSATDCAFVQFALGIERTSKDQILLFPVPSSGMISVKNPEMENLLIEIYSIEGRIIKTVTANADSEIDLTLAPKGYYTARVKSEKYTFIKQLILN